MKGILKNTPAGWYVWYSVMRDEITSGYDSIPVYQETFDFNGKQPIVPLVEGKKVEFRIEDFWETGGDESIKLAKLIIPKEEPKINLEEMSKEEWDEARNPAYKHFDIDAEYPELDGTNALCNDKIWDDIYHDYTAEQYPAFGGPFTDSISFIDWLKQNYKSPEKK